MFTLIRYRARSSALHQTRSIYVAIDRVDQLQWQVAGSIIVSLHLCNSRSCGEGIQTRVRKDKYDD
jgi:hypothetical protein